MPITLIRDLVAAKSGAEPEAFQFLTDHEPEISWFRQLFAIDLRSLATLRILLGLISIGFVFMQFGSAKLLYSENGILNQALNEQLLGDGFWSVFWLNKSFSFTRTIFIFTGLIAFAFALGYQTKIMNAALLVLIWSIQVRNPLVLTGGDVLLRMLLFWSLFLPTHLAWSIDANQMDERPDGWKIASFGTVAIMLQLVYMYFFTGLAKLNPFWLNGDAIEYAMNLEMSVKPLGEWLANYPQVLYFATIATVVAEILILFLIFVPRLSHLNRGMMLGFFLMMHIGIWLTMSIGLFSITAIVAWVIFFPSDIWNTFWGEPVGYSEKRFYRDEFELQSKIVNILVGVFLVYITVQNIAFALGPNYSKRLASLELIGRTTMTIQQFHMFAKPPLHSPWFEYNAQLDSGQRVDLFDGEPRKPKVKPPSVYKYMKSQNWRRIHWNLITHPKYPPETELIYRQIRKNLLVEFVEKWDNQHQEDPVLQAELKCHLEPIKLARDLERQPSFANHEKYELLWAVYQSVGKDSINEEFSVKREGLSSDP